MTGSPRLDEFIQSFYRTFEFTSVPCRAFPYNDYSPAFFFQSAQHALITLLIIFKLFLPLSRIISIGISQFTALMLVPVAAVNKHSYFMTAQNNIRFYFAHFAVNPKPIT